MILSKHLPKCVSRWELKRPGAECSWLVTITGSGLVEFAEKKTDQSGGSAVCSGAPKRVVTIAVSISGTVDVTGGCNTPGNLKLTCEHAAPDSVTIPDWDIWAFGYIKASGYSDPVPSMTFVSKRRIPRMSCTQL